MDARSHTIRLRVNDVEKAQIEGAAAGRGLGVSAYLRGCHAAVLRGGEMPSADSSDPTDRLAAKLTARPKREGPVTPRQITMPNALQLAGRMRIPQTAASRLLARGAVGVLDGRLVVEGRDEGAWP